MRAVIGSTFLLATLAGSFLAHVGSVLHIAADRSGISAAGPATISADTLGIVASAAAIVAAVASHSQGSGPSLIQPSTGTAQHTAIAGGLASLSAVLCGIHRRRPAVLRL